MAVMSIEDLKDAVASLIEGAYGAEAGSLRYQPSEDASSPAYSDGDELPIIYTEWKLDFDLASNIALFRSERDQHLKKGSYFPHCWMIDIGGFSGVNQVFGRGNRAKEREIVLKIWFFYGYYNGSSSKMTQHLMTVSDYINDNLVDLGMNDPSGFISAEPIQFQFPSIDKMDFDEEVTWLAQGTQKFTIYF